jgi:uncharacterized membrane protein YebE (DUF533 family)
MDLGRILGAVLSGAATRTTRRRASRATGPFGMTQTQTRQVGRLVGTLATIAADALARRAPAEPAPAEATPARRRAEPPARTEIAAPIQRGPVPARRLPETAPKPAAPAAESSVALLILRAMIAAARADGALDRAERAAIATQLDGAGLDPSERDHVLADFDAPASIEELARQARDPMLAAQLYAAACAAAGEVSPAERLWLDRFGTALRLDKAAQAAIEKRLAA